MSLLTDRFLNGCSLFNSGKYDQLAPLLRPDVIMKKVDDPDSVVGIGNVISYLNSQQKPLLPQFDPDGVSEFPQPSDAAMHGVISGQGTYQDISIGPGSTLPFPVRYSFTFTRKNTSAMWLLIHASAVHIP